MKAAKKIMADILVVEDEIAIAELLLILFEDAGHTVRAAQHGEEALAAILERRPDLVLTDRTMPVMSGPEFVASLQATGDLADTPIIVMSALPKAEVLATYPCQAPFIQKPFRLHEVAAAVELVLAQKALPA